MFLRLLVIALAAVVPTFAQAYIGPGLGVGAIAAALGVVAAIALAVFAVIYYPIKRMRKNRRPASRKVAGPGE
jgi:hypothetical protein